MWASGAKAAAGISSASQHVHRTGAAGPDYTKVDLEIDGNWHDMTFASICPVGTTIIHLKMRLYTGEGAYWVFQLRKKGDTDGTQILRNFTYQHVADFDHHVWIACDTDRLIQYSSQIVVWQNLDIQVQDYIRAAI